MGNLIRNVTMSKIFQMPTRATSIDHNVVAKTEILSIMCQTKRKLKPMKCFTPAIHQRSP